MANHSNLIAELPQLVSSSYQSTAIDMQTMLADGAAAVIRPTIAGMMAASKHQWPERHEQPAKQGVNAMANVARRLVQVFIADTDENVPLADCLLYKGEPTLTDLTDQELFFEVDIRTILDQHNQKRTALINKTVKERTEHLEPARIRDLKMTVVTIAQF